MKNEKSGKIKKVILNIVFFIETIGFPLIVAFLFISVLPTFKSVFESFGKELPTATRILIKLSDLANKYIIVFIVFIVMFITAMLYFLRKIGEKARLVVVIIMGVIIFTMIALLVISMFMPMFVLGNVNP